MTSREKNLWGLIAGLVLAISLGFYKISHVEIATNADSSPAEQVVADEWDEVNAADAGAYDEEGEVEPNAMDAMAGNAYNEGEYPDAGEVQPPQNLLPGNAMDAAAIDDQPNGGEE